MKLFMSAGEVSGDMYGGDLIQALRRKDPSIECVGMGHHQMRAAGATILADVTTASTIGFIEPIRYIPRLLRTYYAMKRALITQKPDAVIVIDYQGYHQWFATAAMRYGIPVIYYIAPQEWQWGTEAGGRRVVGYTHKIMAIFKEEADFYTRLGGDVTFVGHPIRSRICPQMSRDAFYAQEGILLDKRIVSGFPGSRVQELTHLLPIFLPAVASILTHFSDVVVRISVASPVYAARIQAAMMAYGLTDRVALYTGDSHELIQHTHVSIVSSGTVTLEHACLGVPFIANYRLGRLSYAIAKAVVGSKITHIALPNNLAKRRIVPEYIQDDCTVNTVVAAATDLLSSPAKHARMQDELRQVAASLGDGGAADKAAQVIMDYVGKKK